MSNVDVMKEYKGRLEVYKSSRQICINLLSKCEADKRKAEIELSEVRITILHIKEIITNKNFSLIEMFLLHETTYREEEIRLLQLISACQHRYIQSKKDIASLDSSISEVTEFISRLKPLILTTKESA